MNKRELNDLAFIKKIGQISILKISKEKKINMSNLYNKPNQPKSRQNAKAIRIEIEKQIDEAYEELIKKGD